MGKTVPENMTDSAPGACVVCGAKNDFFFMEAENIHGATRLSREKFNLVKCAGCGVVHVEPMPAEEEIWNYYGADYYRSGSRIKIRLERMIGCWSNLRSKGLIAKFSKGGRLLDIGCGRGEFLKMFRGATWDLYGVEPNKEGYAQNIAKGYSKIFNQDLISCAFQSDYFDVVTMWHVFEHVRHPNRQLREIHSILKDHGLLIIAVPNIEGMGFKLGGKHWFHLDCPRHLYHYNPHTIRLILNNNGLNVVKIYYPFICFPLDIAHSLGNAIENTMLRRLLLPALIVLSVVFKFVGSVLKVSETMTVVCEKSGPTK
jgi:SAM-dependent methyltransferase